MPAEGVAGWWAEHKKRRSRRKKTVHTGTKSLNTGLLIAHVEPVCVEKATQTRITGRQLNSNTITKIFQHVM